MASRPSNQRFPSTNPSVSFPELEERVLAFWKEDDTFLRSIQQREEQGAPDYVFYDGPPFATGLPHYGHILTSYIKDTVPRYFTMKGFRVDRRFGWDTHGLPIETEIEKEMGISGKKAIEGVGIAEFNKRCATAVLRYTKEWEEIITRLGRWVDFRRDYKTMDLSYMESVMWVFHRLWEKGLVYEGDKVVPYSYGAQTTLSNFEAKLDDSFRPRQDPSVTLRFKLRDSKLGGDEYILAWTTTPWTLPSNMALAVGPDVDYALFKDDTGYYWIAEARVAAYEKLLASAEKVRTAKGAELAGRTYDPLFRYFEHLRAEGAFRVLTADFVTTEDGTGIVHVAPAFGEEDYELGKAQGVPRPCPVDDAGCFTEPITDFLGQNVHDANKPIMKWLKDAGSLVRQETIEHNYPHCWRTDTPLIYRTVPTWYVDVLKIKERMQAANQKINWVPDHIRDGRFGDWLANARDWAISRSRFWGAPIPIWKCDVSGELYVPASVAELSSKCGREVTDLHRPAIDEVTFPSPAGGTFRRVPEVLDCWFESGAMPYAQVHYPFENKEWFEKNFPADFIVEYIAQTRGWFYTLVVLGAALFDCPPFKNCLCHGVVLAADGRKMSKRLKNYPDPMDVVHKYGSDSLRIALLSSPVVRGGNLCFKERDVEEAMRSFMIPFWNAYHFFCTYANIDGWQARDGNAGPRPHTRSDRYILAKLEQLKADVSRFVETYDIVSAYEALFDFIDQMNNWYIRLNRRRFWSDEADAEKGGESKDAAYETLYTVLRELALISAPLTPFLSEEIYRGLVGTSQSVHLADWPVPRPELVDAELVAQVESVQKILFLGRQIREKHRIKNRQPLRSVGLTGVSQDIVDAYGDEIRTELNVKEVAVLPHPEQLVRAEYKPVSGILGPKHGKDFKTIMNGLRSGDVELLDDGRAKVAGFTLEADEYTVQFVTNNEHLGCATAGSLIVILSVDLEPELVTEGLAREVVRAIQVARKELALEYTERIRVGVETDSEELRSAIAAHGEWIKGETLATDLGGDFDGDRPVEVRELNLGDLTATLRLQREAQAGVAG